MDRRYQVFVSSTYTDLIEERAAVISMLLDLDALPAGMELFPATNDDAWTLIQQVIDESDYYLLVIGGRYGSTDTATDVSYTEMEFDYARGQNKPVMAFLRGDPGKIAVEHTDQNEDSRKKLEVFRAKVEDQVHVKYYTTPDGLQGQVAASFQKLQKSHPAIGWVRGNVQTSSETLQELNLLRKELEDAKLQLSAAREAPPPGTERFAQGSQALTVGGKMVVFLSSDNFSRDRLTFICEPRSTWDALFAFIGPSMMDEAENDALRERVDTWYALTAYDQAQAKAEEAIAADADTEEPWENPTYTVDSGAIWDRDFDTIIVQLRTLGLIAKSERKRGVNTTGTYWTLTPYGDTHLTALRAVLSGKDIGDEFGENRDDDEDGDRTMAGQSGPSHD